MAIFGFMKRNDINRGVEEYRTTAGALLLDVRTPQEYRQGHIPGSQNIPLQQLDEIEFEVEDRNVPLFVYCRSGSRSGQAVEELRSMGYRCVTNIGGIANYSGKIAGREGGSQ